MMHDFHTWQPSFLAKLSTKIVDIHGSALTDILRLEIEVEADKVDPSWASHELGPLEIVLRELAIDEGENRMSVRPGADLYQRSSVAVNPTITSSSTEDESCFQTVRSWLEACQNKHEMCRMLGKSTSEFVPTRLIDLSNGDPRLIVTTSDKTVGTQCK